jgi:hypothetical protein
LYLDDTKFGNFDTFINKFDVECAHVDYVDCRCEQWNGNTGNVGVDLNGHDGFEMGEYRINIPRGTNDRRVVDQSHSYDYWQYN